MFKQKQTGFRYAISTTSSKIAVLTKCYLRVPLLDSEMIRRISAVSYATHIQRGCWPYAGFDHPNGQGRIKTTPCPVLFDVYIPHNIHRYKFYTIVVRGSHSHYLPYPIKLPNHIREAIRSAIRKTDLLNITPRTFSIYNADAKAYLKKDGSLTTPKLLTYTRHIGKQHFRLFTLAYLIKTVLVYLFDSSGF